MNNRFASFLRLSLLFVVLAGIALPPQTPAYAAASLTVQPLTWNIIGLDSNRVNDGPNNFPVGARVCNVGTSTAFNVRASFVWDSANSYINLRPGTAGSGSLGAPADLPASGTIDLPNTLGSNCTDFYFEVEVTRDPAAYDTTRSYHISVTADGGATTGSTPTPRELYVEHLVSQSRNAVTEVQLDGVAIPAGGTMTLAVGNTYNIKLIGYTATQGYNQLESFINFPNTIFQVNSVVSTYTAFPTGGSPSNKLYADSCGWDNVPSSLTYRSCITSDDKSGGSVTVTYNVTILKVPAAPLVNPEPLSTLLYDFSGSSYHYNSDYGISTRYSQIIDPSTAVTISKAFSPSTIPPGGSSTLTVTLTNTSATTISGANFSDTLPILSGSQMVVATPATYSSSGCGSAPTLSFTPVAGVTSFSVSGATLAPNGSCTLSVSVSVPSTPTTGTYPNQITNFKVGTSPTAGISSNTANLTVDAAAGTAGSGICGLTLATWTFPGITTNQTINPAPTTNNLGAGNALASSGAGITKAAPSASPYIRNATHTADGSGSWSSNGLYDSVAALNTASDDYFEFALNTTGYISIDLSFWGLAANGNAPEQVVVYSGTTATPPGTLRTTLGTPPGTTFPGTTTWSSSGTINFPTAQINPSGFTYFRIYGAYAKNNNPGSDLFIDDVIFTGCGTAQKPTITKTFLTNPIVVGGTSTLTFTITNPNTTQLTGAKFTDTLPSGLQVAATPNASTACTGAPTWVPIAGATTLNFGQATGANIPASNFCTVSVDVTATTAGPHPNVSGYISTTESGTNSTATGSAKASLVAVLPPSIEKVFNPNPVIPGSTSTLTFTITNPNPSDALPNVAFTDTFPTTPGNMVVATSPNATTSGCGAPTFTPAAGAASISFSGGTITAGGTCTVTVNVTVPVGITGNYANVTSAVTTTIGGLTRGTDTASSTLTVNPPSPHIALTKQVSASSTGPWSNYVSVPTGATVYYRLTVENTGDVPLNTTTVTDPDPLLTLCTAAQWQASNASWPTLPVASPTQNPAAVCTVSITSVVGNHPNTATATGVYSGTNYTDTGTATYVGVNPPTVTKVFSPNPITPGGTSTLTLTITNPASNTVALTGVGFTDTYPVGMQNAAAPAASTTCSGGTVTAAANGPSVSLSGATLAANTSCTVSVDVTAASDGSYPNTVTVSTTNGGSSTPANGTLTVSPVADLSVTKTDGSTTYTPGGTTTYTIVASNAGPSAVIGAALTDTFPASITATWTCVGAGGASCPAVSGSGNINATANIPSGGSLTYTVTANINAGTIGSLSNTATIAVPVGTTDPNLGNNSATDVDTINPLADLSITKTDSGTTYFPGMAIGYTVVAINNGPSNVVGATVADTIPANITGATWTCSASAGASCTASGSGNINDTVTIPVNGTVTYKITGVISGSATGNLSNGATVTVPVGITDPVPGNNSANDTDTPAACVAGPFASWTFTGDTTSIASGVGLLTYDTVGLNAPIYPTSQVPANNPAISFTGAQNASYTANSDFIDFAVPTNGRGAITMSFIDYRSTTGPDSFVIYYSTDGTTYNALPPGTVYSIADTAWTARTIDFSGVASLNNISTAHFRIYPYRAAAGGTGAGTWRLDNVSFNGDCLANLTLQKIVVNDNGGTAVDANWTLVATRGAATASGTEGSAAVTNAVVPTGTWTLSESGGPAGYTASAWGCIGAADGNPNDGLTLAAGENVTCTITNDDNAPSLTLIKTVTNDNGGTNVATDWTLTAVGALGTPTNLSGTTPVASGAGFKADTYTLAETGPAGYTPGTWSCTNGVIVNSGQITLGLGASTTCTINNDDNLPTTADVTTTVTVPATANAGSTVNGTVTFANNGPTTAAGVGYTFTMTPGLGTVTFPTLPAGVTASYNNATGAVTLTGIPTSLTSGQGLSIGLSYTAPASGPVTVNTGITTTTSQGVNAAPDTANGSTTITPIADVTTTVSVPANATSGSTVNGTVTFSNNGPSTAAGITYSFTITPGLGSVTFPALPAGVSASYDNTTGTVTLTGMPTSLTSGQTLTIDLSYTAPATGPVTVNTSISTTTSQGANAAPDSASGSTAITPIADVTTTVSVPATANAGSTVNGTVTFANNGPSPAAGVGYTFTMTSGLGTVSFPTLPAGVTASYDNATGTVTLTGMPASLTSGQNLTIDLSYTAPSSGPVIVNTSISTTTSQGANAAPDSATGSTMITPIADVTTTVTVPASANAGSTVNGTVTFANNGPSTASGVGYTFTMTPGLGTVSFPALPAGVTANYNNVTGAVTLTGMPASLTSGQTLTLDLSYTAPSSGPVTVNTGISTTTSQGANNAPDNASGLTAIAPIADVTTTVSVPANTNAGNTVNGTVTFANNGPSTAAGVSYTFTMTPGLGTVTFPTLPAGVTASYNNATGTVSLTGMPTSLTSGQTLTIDLSYAAPATGPVTVNTAISTTTSQGANVAPDNANGSTTISPIADVTTTVTVPASANAGGTVNGTVTFANNGPSTAENTTYTFTMSSGLGTVSFPTLPAGVTASYNNVTGTVTLTGMPTSLSSGQTLTIDLSYTAPATGPVTVDTTISTTTSQGANVAPDAATGSTTITPIADVTTMVIVPATANAGSTVNGTVTFANNGPSTAAGVGYTFTMTPGLGTVSFPTLPVGVSASYDNTTGTVTLTGMPTSLASGQTLTIDLSYTAPATGPVAVNTTISTTTSQGANAAPDNASGSTTITPIADVTTTVSVPATANAGSTVNGTVTFVNNGPSTAAGVGYTFTMTPGLGTVSFPTLPTGVTASYDDVTGTVSLIGMPTNLTSGQTLTIDLSYTAPATGPVTVATSISTTTSQGANTAPDSASGTTTIVPIADVTTTVSVPATANAGSTVNGTVTFSNNGPSTAAGVGYTFTMTPGLGTVSFPTLPPGVTASYDNATGTVNLVGMPASLTSGQTLTIDLSYTAPATGPIAVNTSISTTTNQGANAAPDNASGSTVISSIADVTTTVTVPATANSGSTVNGTVTFASNGPSTAAGMGYTFTMTPGLGTVSFPTLPAGVSASYNNATGTVTLTGMPATLTSGQTLTIDLSYTAPASGPVSVDTSISTTTNQGANAAPDTASGSTAITPIADVTTTVIVPATANAGGTVNGTVTFANNGPSNAAGVGYTFTMTPGLGTVSFPTLPAGVNASYDNATGTVTLTGMPTSLTSGQTLTIDLSYTAPATGPVTVNTAISTTTSQGANVAPDTASGSTAITSIADVTTTVTVPAAATTGSIVNGTVTFANNGPSMAANITYTFTMSPGLGTVSFPTLPVGVTASYDNITGTVTLTGMPTSLTNGQTLSISLSYTAPATGPVTVNASIITTTSQGANAAPDSASGSTTINTAAIGIAKRVVSNTEVTPGLYEITYELNVKNFSAVALNNIQVTDELRATYPAPIAFTIQSVTSADFTVSGTYSGITPSINLLNGSDTLAAGASGTITLVIRVTPTSSGPFNNTATASGQCPTCITPVTDQSQTGTNPDPDGDNDPTNNNVPTVVNFGPALFDPPIGLKVFDASGLPLLQWTMVWINNSNIVAINAQVTDPIPAGTTYVGGSVTCTPSGIITTVTTCTYDAASNSIIWSGNLGPDLGATDAASAVNEITITFNVNVNAGVRSVQNVATVDADLNGNTLLTDPGEQRVSSASARWTAGTTASSSLPATGFAPNVVTELQPQPLDLRYAPTDVVLEIPSLGVKLQIVGVPKKNGTWDVSWLGKQAGWLEGTAFPSWNGNSVLTSHVYQSNGLPGPFVDLGKLKYGEKVIVHAYGQKYTFEVRTNTVVAPNDSSAFKHEEKSWLSLVTCKEYDEKTNTYKKRVVVRAVLVKVEAE